MEVKERKLWLDARRQANTHGGKKREPNKSRQEMEAACADMFKRDTERRKRLDEQMQAKAVAALPTHKKSAATPLQRDMHFARLSMPNPHTRAPKKPFRGRGGDAPGSRPGSAASADKPRPAWFAGQSRDAVLRKGWQAGSTVYAPASAVH